MNFGILFFGLGLVSSLAVAEGGHGMSGGGRARAGRPAGMVVKATSYEQIAQDKIEALDCVKRVAREIPRPVGLPVPPDGHAPDVRGVVVPPKRIGIPGKRPISA